MQKDSTTNVRSQMTRVLTFNVTDAPLMKKKDGGWKNLTKKKGVRMEIKKFMDLIPDGKDKAIKRKTLVKMADMCGFIPNNVKDKDRYVRKLISKERQTTPILTKPEGGYYVPTPEDTTELAEHITTERGRALVILANVSRAETIFEDLLHRRISEVRRSEEQEA